ncbi:MAG: hypothetical protein HYY26_02100 [Acidobacteria bacterium]|nr:hypothetical protein [Acidobacteriota bacterium]
MKLSVKGMAIAAGLLWGVLGMFLTGLANLIWNDYATGFLQMMASVYPGYHGTPTLGDVIVGALYGLLDGTIAGAIFAWLYNRFASA